MQLDNFSPWLRLDADLLQPLLVDQSPLHFKRKQTIFYEGDSPSNVYVVKEGRVCITTYSQSGAEQQLYIAEKGALFGEHSCLLGIPHTTSAISIVDSELYSIPFSVFSNKLKDSPLLTHQILQIICRKNSLLIGRLLSQSSSDSLQRTSKVLLDMVQEYGRKDGEGLEISIRFSHQDVANLLHTSRVTVTKAFQTLAHEGIIMRKHNHIVICDYDKLFDIASGRWTL